MTESPDHMDRDSALVPQLERELVNAARRDARLVPPASRRGAPRVRTWLRSPLLAAALVILACGAAALAAQSLLLSGAPVTLPRGIPLRPRSGLGVPLPGSSKALTLQVPDPAGGPPWGARFVATTRGYGCLQIGRVVRGQLGVIGEDGAFSDDQRFHALPLDYLEGPFPCAPTDAQGHAFAGVFIDGTPASGLEAEDFCAAPGRHVNLPERVCPARDERLLMAGMAGPLARSVTYADGHGRLRTVTATGPQGAYLIVLPAPTVLGLEAGEYEPLGGPGGGTIREIAYANGRVCRLARGPNARVDVCPPVGQQPLAQPHVSAASVASPVSVRLRTETVALRYRTVTEPMLLISFRARVPVLSASAEYGYTVRFPGSGRNCDITSLGPVDADVRRGQIVHAQVSSNHCRGTFHVRVFYVHGGRTDGLPFDLSGGTLTVGTRAITIR
jgi:hypothetical protein